ncbi:MAG: hypothetical protein LUD48_01165 [Prevotella sp.]|nr:hypothetical protein [Prevotella sp.]
MRKTLLFLFLTSVMSVFAQYTGNGYYRVQNVQTGRYIVLLDDYGKINYTTTDADLNAIRTFKGYETVVSNPGSIIYAEQQGTDNAYRLYSQGTDTYSIVGVYLKLLENSDGTYKAYATYSGATKYLADEDGDYDQGYLLTNGSRDPSNYISNWNIIPVRVSDESNYFGLTPEYTVGDSYYLTFYAAFPFSFASEGMTAYYVSKVVTANDGFGMAVWQEITDEMKPSATPMIVKCSSTEPANNKLNLLSSSSTTVSGNNLAGVYFCNEDEGNHRDVVQYNATTMRILGLTSSGELGFVSLPNDSVYYIPANTAYLKVPEEPGKVAASEFQLVTEEEYEELLRQHSNAGIEIEEVVKDDTSNNNNVSGVYTLTGIKVCEGNALPESIASGIYIVGGKKVVVR